MNLQGIFFAITTSVLLITALEIQAQDVYPGYVLYDEGSTTYLVDQEENVVHQWDNLPNGGYAVYLTDEGTIVRPGESGNRGMEGVAASAGLIQEIDKDGNVLWEFEYTSDSYITHHDIEPMPNGNVLVIVVEQKTEEETSQAGFDSDEAVMEEQILEIQPPEDDNGEASIVWEWHTWDHLTTGNEPELFSVDIEGGLGGGGWEFFASGDWMHMNGVSYNPDLDQIAFSAHYFDEMYVIDHSTTTQEAAGSTGGNSGMGGDLLYRWGNPENYGENGTKWFSTIHSAIWVPAGYPGEGNLMAFNNEESRVYEISPQKQGEYNYVIDGSLQPEWTYQGSNFSQNTGSCQPLPNGNAFICNPTDGHLFEVNEQGDIVWEYTAGRRVTRAMKYGADHPGIMEILGTSVSQGVKDRAAGKGAGVEIVYKGENLRFKNFSSGGRADILTVSGKRVLRQRITGAETGIDISSLPAGMYVVKFRNSGGLMKQRMIRKM